MAVNEQLPKHIAVIMDGNRRWARQHAFQVALGHRKGVEAVRTIVRECDHLGIRVLSLYAFSTENWQREKREVDTLMALLQEFFTSDIDELDEKNVRMLTGLGVFTVDELRSRRDIMLENYCKSVLIEANTMVNMVHKRIAPAITRFTADLARPAAEVIPEIRDADWEENNTEVVTKLSALTDIITERTDALEEALMAIRDAADVVAEAAEIRDEILPRMSELRVPCDRAELLTAKSYWPFPTYGDILFSVR